MKMLLHRIQDKHESSAVTLIHTHTHSHPHPHTQSELLIDIVLVVPTRWIQVSAVDWHRAGFAHSMWFGIPLYHLSVSCCLTSCWFCPLDGFKSELLFDIVLVVPTRFCLVFLSLIKCVLLIDIVLVVPNR
jgi:hypothetical protein